MIARRLWCGIMACLVLLTVVPPIQAQGPAPDPVLEMMAQMTPEHKVGQLVMVAFPGLDVSESSEIVALILEYRIGGVLLAPENGNFGASRIAPGDLLSITQSLQALNWQAAEPSFPIPEASDAVYPPSYLPLFIAVEAHTEGLAVTAFVSETTTLPTPMALGAAWRRDWAEMTGRVLGNEVASLGINLFLGPDLDVLYTPRPGDASDLGTTSFGSDPFWVGELGRAYVAGLHQGAEGHLLVVPRHLPGLGSTDRVLREEVPTVQKTLAQLKQIELAPFFASAKGTPGTDSLIADGFLVTHIRYRGFLGNIRQTTPPISLDAQSLQAVVNLAELSPWRKAGGLLIADNLGAASLHRYYDPRRPSFNARRVMQDALSAGNDVLLLNRFALEGDWEGHFTNVRDVLRFLAGQYKSDATFRTIVDEAVYRIINAKQRLYPELTLSAVLAARPRSSPEISSGISAQVAFHALTLIAPLSGDLLPSPPQEGDQVVIFAQESRVEIPGMEPLTRLSVDAVGNALLHFYGPEGTGMVRANAVRSFSFEQLRVALGESAAGISPELGPSPATAEILTALRGARWIIFAATGLEVNNPASRALKEFLASQADLLDARIVVFSFGPPYELDSTEISKLDLYYALYAAGPVFVDVAVRALFRDILAQGISPVSIPALSYDVSLQTMPDPAQVIPLEIVDEAGVLLAQGDIHKGDVVNLRTGTIYDRNGHTVPDGTPVKFIISYPQEGTARTIATEALNGIAMAAVTLDRVGLLVITVQSDPAISSVSLQLTIPEDQSQDPIIQVVTPTPEPTVMPVPIFTPEPEPPKVILLPEPIRLPEPERAELLWWGLLGVLLSLVGGFLWARARELRATVAFRVGGLGALGALAGYISVLAVVRWQRPVWQYEIAGHEFYLGGIALACGMCVVLLVMLGEWMWRQVRARRIQSAT